MHATLSFLRMVGFVVNPVMVVIDGWIGNVVRQKKKKKGVGGGHRRVHSTARS